MKNPILGQMQLMKSSLKPLEDSRMSIRSKCISFYRQPSGTLNAFVFYRSLFFSTYFKQNVSLVRLFFFIIISASLWMESRNLSLCL